MAFSNEVLQKALAKVLEQKKNAERAFDKQKEDVYAANPELARLDIEMQKLGSSLALCSLSGDTAKSKEILDKLAGIRNEISQLEKSYNLASCPNYTCKVCCDSGYVDGKLCSCVKDIAAKMTYKTLIGDMPIETSTFDTFDLSYYPSERNDAGVSPLKQMTAVLKTCRKFAAEFPSGANLLFTGECGLGKTHLSLAIANEIISKDYNVIYGSAQNLINEVSRESFDRSGSTVKIDSLTSCNLLILDDLGTEFVSPLSISVVYNIINTRLLKGLSTIINTNLNIKEISETYNDRIASRIIGSYTICPFFGNDIRQINSVNN